MLLTSGPQLISIIPNDGSVLLGNATLHTAPTQLTFRFLLSASETLDPNTLSGIELTRSGSDGVFGDATDVHVTPGYIGIDPAQPNQVVMRFSSSLPDDLYRITIIGGSAGEANVLTDTSVPANPFNGGQDYTQDFRLALGPQVLSVVPQPVTRDNTGALISHTNEIDVYFDKPLQTLPGDPTHINPGQFELIATKNTATTADDTVYVADPGVSFIQYSPTDGLMHVPGSVIYDAQNNEARIVFQNVSSTPISINTFGSGAGAFRLRIGNTDAPVPQPSSPTPYTGGLTGTFAGAAPIGPLGTPSTLATQIYDGNLFNTTVLDDLVFPGGIDDPGHRDFILDSKDPYVEDHTRSTVSGGVRSLPYYFPDVYGNDPVTGQPLHNQITPNEKQTIREILQLYSYYTGINAYETPNLGMRIFVGDLRTLQPDLPTPGPGGLGAPGVLGINGNIDWGAALYGSGFMNVAMHEIGHALGLPHNDDGPPGTIMNGGAEAGVPTAGPAAPPIYPGLADITNLQFGNEPNSNQIDLYKFTVDSNGKLSAQVKAQELASPSQLNSLLTIYEEFTDLNLPASGSSIVNGHTFKITDNNGPPGVTFEFTNDKSQIDAITGKLPDGNFGVSFSSSSTRQDLAVSMVIAVQNAARVAGLNATATIGTAGVQLAGPITVDASLAPEISVAAERTLIARNDDYYGRDSFIGTDLGPGIYYAAVTSTGNDQFNPNVPASGWGGRTQGNYQLLLGFLPNSAAPLTDAGLSLFVPAAGASAIPNGYSFTLTDINQSSGQPVTEKLVFTTAVGPPAPGEIWISLQPTDTQNDVANKIIAALQTAIADGGFDASNYILSNIGNGRIQVGGASGTRIVVDASGKGALTGTPLVLWGDTQRDALVGNSQAGGEGAYNFWFNVGQTVYVDKTATAAQQTAGVLDASGGPAFPLYNSIQDALSDPLVTSAGGNGQLVNVRVEGNANDSLAIAQNQTGAAKIKAGDIFQVSAGSFSGTFEFVASGTNGSQLPDTNFAVLLSSSGNASELADNVLDALNVAVKQLPNGGTASLADAGVTVSKTAGDGNYQYVKLYQSRFPLSVNYQTTSQPTAFNPVLPGVPAPSLVNNAPYLIGTDQFGNLLPDNSPGDSLLQVPKNVVLMADAGALFKLDKANIIAGSSAVNIDHSQSALQVLGVPGNRVTFTSYNDDTIGTVQTHPGVAVKPGDWGGLVFNDDSDLETLGVFLNNVSEAKLNYGGGQVFVNGVPQFYDAIYLGTARPAVSNNLIINSASAAISGNPNSFESSRFGSVLTLNVSSTPSDGQTFSVGNTTFEFDGNGVVGQGHVAVAYLGLTNAEIATAISAAINQALFANSVDKAQAVGTRVTLPMAMTHGPDTATVQIGSSSDTFSADYQRFGPDIHGDILSQSLGASLTAPAGSVLPSGTTFIVNHKGFELLSSGTPLPGYTAINFTASSSAASIAQAIAAAINQANLGVAVQWTAGQSTVKITGAFNLQVAAPLVVVKNSAQNTTNGIFVRINTNAGQSLDTLDVSAEFATTDLPYVLQENLVIHDGLGYVASAGSTAQRLSGQLLVDPGVVVKLAASRIEAGMASNLIAEGTAAQPVIFTSLNDVRFGGGGTFDTANSGGTVAAKPGDWGGFYFWPTSSGSFDHALITYGGGAAAIEGGFDNFNAVEIHQAKVRIADSTLENNAGGGGGDRNGRIGSDASTIFVLGSQPVLVNNVIQDNQGAAISTDVQSLTTNLVPDWGRSTTPPGGYASLNIDLTAVPSGTGGPLVPRYSQFDDNYGPLVRLNRIGDDGTNGMVVRGSTLETASIWDDTDVVHVLEGTVTVPNFQSVGGLRLQSSATQSLVVKAKPGSGLIASGEPINISDRIGGEIQILGTPQHPVVLTSIKDDSVGAGLTPSGQPNNDTNNDGAATTAQPGDWGTTDPINPSSPGGGIIFNQYSNDRNVAMINQTSAGPTPATAQLLGTLAPNQQSGDDNSRLGFQVNGFIGAQEVDTYTFKATAGTQVWLNVTNTSSALDAVLELVDASGTVLARSNNSLLERNAADPLQAGAALQGLVSNNLARPLQGGTSGTDGKNFWSTNAYDPGFRVVLPGTAGNVNNYYVRIYAKGQPPAPAFVPGNGAAGGKYQLQVRLQEQVEIPGSAVSNADIRYVTNGIDVEGLPAHSPLVSNTSSGAANHSSFNSAQDIGNLLTSDTSSINVGGNLANPAQVDWYKFELTYSDIQAIKGVNGGPKSWSTIFDIGYADGLTRANTVIDVYDSAGNLIYTGRDSNIADQQPRPNAGQDASNLTHSSFGTLDPYIGPAQLPTGVPDSGMFTYYVAIHSSAMLPSALDGTFRANSSNYLVRLEPVDSINRVVEDHIGVEGGQTAQDPATLQPLWGATGPAPPTTPPQPFAATTTTTDSNGRVNAAGAAALNTYSTPFSLSDVVLFVNTGGSTGRLETVNPFTGQRETDQGAIPSSMQVGGFNNIAMRNDGLLYGISTSTTSDSASGQYVQINTGTPGSSTIAGNTGINTYYLNGTTVTQANDGVQMNALAFVQTDPTQRKLYALGSDNSVRNGAQPFGNGLYQLDPTTGAVVPPSSGGINPVPTNPAPPTQPQRRLVTDGSSNELTETLTGMAYVNGKMYCVGSLGGLYRLDLSSAVATQISAPALAGLNFTSLSAGPPNVEGGAYKNTLFAAAGNRLYAFDENGVLQPIFAGGATSISLGVTSVTGIAFSTLDYNLWHVTNHRAADLGHGIASAPDNSRTDKTNNPTQSGGTSFYFGLEKPPSVVSDSLNSASQPDAANYVSNPTDYYSYNMPGGAYGSLSTNTFSLSGSSAADKPTMYFNYFLNTQDASGLTNMLDSARVLISEDGGLTWNLLATNNLYRPGWQNAEAELPYYQSINSETGSVDSGLGGSQGVQPLFDSVTTNTGWRQARVDLSDYAGQNNLQLRFDFSTSGTTLNPGDLATNPVTGAPNPYANAKVAGNSVGNFNNPARGQNNGQEGWYIDDVMIGFAERGEMVTNPRPGLTTYDNLLNNPYPLNPTLNPDPGKINEVLTGQYQLEIRDGTTYGRTFDKALSDVKLESSFDTNTRFTQAYSLSVPAGIFINSGQTFTLNDGVNAVNFEFVQAVEMLVNGAFSGFAFDTQTFTLTNGGVSTTFELVTPSTTPSPGVVAVHIQNGDLPSDVVNKIVATIDSVAGYTAHVVNGNYIYVGGTSTMTLSSSSSLYLPVIVSSASFSSGHAPVFYSLLDPAQQLADRVVAAINANPTLSGVGAADVNNGVQGTVIIPTTNIVNLFGVKEAHVAATSLGLLHYDKTGDATKPRPQGEVILYGNQISNVAQNGILVEGVRSDAGGANLPYPGGVVNTPTLNTGSLAPGVVIANNLIYGIGASGIAFQGNTQGGGAPQGVVPFGRIVNNTIYGGDTPTGTGILVNNFAYPTILNNVLVNLATGRAVFVQNGSQVVLGENFYQNDGATPTNVGVGSFAQVAASGAPSPFQFASTDPRKANFYLTDTALPIDSSINSLQDRTSMTSVTAPIGIPPSPIIAPSYDLYGQLRVDDPDVANANLGAGSNVFIDRGAVEHADAVGPSAALLAPVDNDSNDLNTSRNFVFLRGQSLSEFTIQLNDGSGSGIYDASVSADRLDVREDGRLLTPGVDYFFDYDNNNHIIHLVAASGVWLNGHQYDIYLDNGNQFDPSNPSATPVGITDRANNLLQANGPDGLTHFRLLLANTANQAPTIALVSSATMPLMVFENNATHPNSAVFSWTAPFSTINSASAAVSIFDVDSNGGSETLSLEAAHGTLSLSVNALAELALLGVTPGNGISGNGTATLAITAPLGEADAFTSTPGIVAALEGLIFTPDADFDSHLGTLAVVTATINDNGNTPAPALSATISIPINVVAINVAPSFTEGPDEVVNEDAGPQSIANWATSISAGPNEADQTLNFQVSNDNNGLFSVQPAIDPLTGTLTFTPAPNANGAATVTVYLHDNGGTANGGVDTSAAQTFTITVNPVNDAPIFTPGGNQTVNEDAGPQIVGWASGISAGPSNEAGQTVNFLVTNDDNSLFSAQPTIDATGKLSYTPAANAYGVATVTVYLHDDGGTANGGIDTSAPVTFTITVNPVNDAPSFTKGADQTVFEDAGAQTVTPWATAISPGPNEATQALNFLISSDNPALFSAGPAINPITGTLTYTAAPNAFGTATVTVRLHDDGGTANGGVDTSAAQTFTITIIPINDAPTFTKGADQTINEDAGPQTVANWATGISAGPNEASQTLTFLISSDNPALFAAGPSIDPLTGKLTYTTAPNANGAAHVTVQLQDNGGTANGGVDTSAAQTFTITVNPVNDAPSFTAGADQTINEDAGPQTVASWATNISFGPANETGQALNFLISSDNPSLFSVAPSIDLLTGTLTYTPAANAYGVAHVSVQLHDDGGTANGGVDTSPVTVLTITVNAVNDVPTFTKGADQSVLEDAGPQTVAGWATGISAGPNEASQALNFLISSDNPSLFSAGPAIDPLTGNLTYTPAANAYGTATVTVQLHDDGGTANGGVDTSAAQTFTITITPVNDAPTFTPGANQTVLEDAGAQTVAAWATAISDGPNETGQSVDFLVSNNNNSLFSVQPSIDATGKLTYTPAANAYGTATVTVQLHDDGGTANGGVDTSTAKTFTITLTPVNDAPTFTAGADQTVNENAGPQTVLSWATNISPGPNETGQTLNFLVSVDNPSLFSAGPSIDVATGTLTYTPALNVSGVAYVTVTLQDNGGTANGGVNFSTQTFKITVNFVNHAPSFVKGPDQTVNEDAPLQTIANWATNLNRGPDPIEAFEQLNFIVATNNNALFSTLPAIDSSGKLTYQPAPNVNGTATVTVYLHDDGGTANGGVDTSAPQTFIITVNSVNDVPSFTAGGNQTVNEDAGPQTVSGWATNISAGPNEGSQTLNFLVSASNSSLFSAQPAIDASGNLTYTPAPNANGTSTVTVYLHDNGGTANGGVDTSAAQTFTITVTPVNDAPSFTGTGNQVLNQNSGQEITVIWATNIKPGPLNEAGQALNFVVSNDNPGLFSEQPSIDPNGILTYRAQPFVHGSATVTVYLHDDGGTANGGVDTSATQTFTITVNQVNQAPSFTSGGNQTVNEDAGAQTAPGWATNISAGPNESSQTLNFLVSNNNPSLFSVAPAVDAATGTLTYTPAANAYGTATVTVTLKDDGGTANGGVDSFTQTITITINPVNDAPAFTSSGNQTVNEDAGAQSVLGWATGISAGPPNESSQTLNFLVTTDNPSLFSVAPAVNASTGALTYTPAANAYGSATVTVTLKDNGGTANGGVDALTQTFIITVNPVNDAPSFTSGGNRTVLEDAGPQTFSAWATNINAGPNESSQTLNFVATTNNPGLFAAAPAIDPISGNLTFTTAANAYGSATVTVTLHDNGGTANGGVDASTTKTFTITVTSVNDAPSFTGGGDQTVNQDAGPQTVAGWATNISDGPNETGQALTFLVSNTNTSLFSVAPAIDPGTGTLTYTFAPHAFGQSVVTVQLRDSGGTANGGVNVSATQTFTITANFVNQAPSFTAGPNQTVNENAGPQAVAAWAKSINQGAFESGQTLNFIVTSDNPGLFSAGPAIDPATGKLTYTPAADMSGTATVTVQLHDDAGTANGGVDTSPAQTFTITVNLINHAPSFTLLPQVAVDQDSPAQSIPNVATNISAGPNEQGQNLNFIVTTDNPSLFSVAPALDANGTLTFTPAANKRGTANVTVKLHDDGGTARGGVDTSAPQTFQIVLNPVNHAPTVVTPIADRTLNENAADVTFSVANVFDDIDLINGDHLALTLANDNPDLLGATLAGGMLTLHLKPNQFGAAHLDLQAADDLGLTIDEPFTVNVNAVNQAPSFTRGADERVALGSGPFVQPGWATNLSAGPANEASQTLSFQVTGDSNPALFLAAPSVSPSGALSFTPAPGVSGTATITLVLKDSGGTANGGVNTSAPQTFHITVNAAPVAHPDTVVLSDTSSSSATASVGVLVNDTDANGDPLTALIVSPPAHGTLSLNPDGSFTYVKGADFAGLDYFTYRASDGLANSGDVTVRVLSYQASIVDKLYQQVLHRSPDDNGLLYWTNRIMNGDPYSVIAQGIFESNERLDPIIRQYYQDYLLRPADAAGLAYWRDKVWKRDGGPENVVAGMISSAEFFQSAGGTNAAWVEALYERLLHRPADPSGLSYWTTQLNLHQATQQQVVLGFVRSDENFQNLITGFYQQYLQRNPTASELNAKLQEMRNGASQRDIQIEIINSQEYRNTPPPPASGLTGRLLS